MSARYWPISASNDGSSRIGSKSESSLAADVGATTVEIPTNHVAMVSHPDDVLHLIETAAKAVSAAS